MNETITLNKSEAGELMRANFQVLNSLLAEERVRRDMRSTVPQSLTDRIARLTALDVKLTAFVDGK